MTANISQEIMLTIMVSILMLNLINALSTDPDDLIYKHIMSFPACNKPEIKEDLLACRKNIPVESYEYKTCVELALKKRPQCWSQVEKDERIRNLFKQVSTTASTIDTTSGTTNNSPTSTPIIINSQEKSGNEYTNVLSVASIIALIIIICGVFIWRINKANQQQQQQQIK